MILSTSFRTFVLYPLIVVGWEHRRIPDPARRRRTRHGREPYVDYMARVKRWIPGLF